MVLQRRLGYVGAKMQRHLSARMQDEEGQAGGFVKSRGKE